MSKVERHMAICKELNALFERKNHDYGDSFSKTYKELGIVSAVTQIMHKHHRLVELAVGTEQKVAGESIRDTLIDLANYAIMTVMELDGDRATDAAEKKSTTTKWTLNYNGHNVTLRCADGKFTLRSACCTICNLCRYEDADQDDEPCCNCVHHCGNNECFMLKKEVKVYERF